MVCVRVLGSFAAERDGRPIPLGGRRQRAVLALLVSARGQVVSVDRMIEELWQGAPPAQAVTSLQAYVSNLRRLLEPGRAPRTPAKLLVSAPPGYALRLPEDAVDAWRFERLLRDARESAAQAAGGARPLLAEALALWQGPAYAEFADDTWARSEITRLDELRLSARESAVDAALRAGDLAAAVTEAELLTGDDPLREEGWRLRALSLWAAGRQADALAALREARAVLADEVGLDPGPALTGLEQAILGGRTEVLAEATGEAAVDSALVDSAAADIAPSAVASVDTAPADARDQPDSPSRHPSASPPPSPQPADPDALFVGRDGELQQLLQAASRATTAGPGIALVTGEAGLGKSAVLGHLGERLRADGWLVALGRNTDAEGAPPAWAWVEALRSVAAAVPPPAEAADILAPLLADEASAAAPHDHAAGRFRLHRAVWRWLADIARERPVAVMLDDLHWADAETLALLAELVDAPAGARILVVAAYRPDEVEGPLADGLAVLARRSPLRVPLPGLP
ncbi:MAG: AAA family ATPase, partial [Streptomycetaceae bacterium]|nr:AAA family ATPase [Streptomycetaceae bacterium]